MTVSLDTAVKLKEAGFPQDTAKFFGSYDTRICRPDSDELLARLPEALSPSEEWLSISKLEPERGFSVGYGPIGYVSPEFLNKSLPEALAECWLWLRKEGVV